MPYHCCVRPDANSYPLKGSSQKQAACKCPQTRAHLTFSTTYIIHRLARLPVFTNHIPWTCKGVLDQAPYLSCILQDVLWGAESHSPRLLDCVVQAAAAVHRGFSSRARTVPIEGLFALACQKRKRLVLTGNCNMTAHQSHNHR